MFNSGDKVEEIATGRQGVVAASGRVGEPPYRWTVQFNDGKAPLIMDFSIAAELRLIPASTEPGPPALVPEKWVV